MPLQSKLFRGDQKLEAASKVDSAHIIPGASGPHVAKIQQALNEVAGARLAADGIYGTLTAAAVAKFKQQHKPPILNFAGKIDNIVGIKTMAALDAELPRRGGGHPLLAFDLLATSLDIVINFIGAAGAHLRPADEALPPSMLLDLYDPIEDPKNRSLRRSVVDNSLLLRIAHSTTEIGPLRSAVFSKVIKIINDTVEGGDPENGNIIDVNRIFVLGSSSGGRNAIDFVGELSKSQFETHFVAPIDASFFPDDTQTTPRVENGQLITPIFTLQAAAGAFAGTVAKVKHRHNYFQTRGNHRKQSLRNRFTSHMAGDIEEIHGQVEGFIPHHLVISGRDLSDDDCHEAADPDGRFQAQRLIANQLTS